MWRRRRRMWSYTGTMSTEQPQLRTPWRPWLLQWFRVRSANISDSRHNAPWTPPLVLSSTTTKIRELFGQNDEDDGESSTNTTAIQHSENNTLVENWSSSHSQFDKITARFFMRSIARPLFTLKSPVVIDHQATFRQTSDSFAWLCGRSSMGPHYGLMLSVRPSVRPSRLTIDESGMESHIETWNSVKVGAIVSVNIH